MSTTEEAVGAQNNENKDVIAVFQACLKAPGPYADDDQKELCKQMVEALPDELVIHAAKTSYAFWYLSLKPETCPSEEEKIAMAMREARRHLVYMEGDYEKGLQNLIEGCEYRKEHKLDLLRTCFDSAIPVEPDDEEKSKEMASLIEEDMKKQYCIMRGNDRNNRTIMIKLPRTETGTVEEGYVMAQLYMAERSTASTEYLSVGTEEKSLAIYDYVGFDSNNAPAFNSQVTAATLLQKTFPERLQTLVMIEPPFWLKGVLTLIKPFLSGTITERIKLVSGKEEKNTVFGEMVDVERATPAMMEGGKLDAPVSLAHFLRDVPFYRLYDDIPCERELEPKEKEVLQPIASPSAISMTQSFLNSIF